MSARRRRIVILVHERDGPDLLEAYLVADLARLWIAEGFEVVQVAGPDRSVDGDLAFVHVDLSVVPEPYLAWAAAFPASVNARVRDIRKRAVSANLLGPGDGWDGPVMVKSDRNYGGVPEALRGVPRLDGSGFTAPFASPADYRLFPSLAEVPPDAFASEDLVVERFLPEVEAGRYHVRYYQFLGDRFTSTRLGGPEPIVKFDTHTLREDVEPHADVLALRRSLGLDYGKIDYVVRDGRAVIFDVNKTTGAPTREPDPARGLEARRTRAAGIHAFFRD